VIPDIFLYLFLYLVNDYRVSSTIIRMLKEVKVAALPDRMNFNYGCFHELPIAQLHTVPLDLYMNNCSPQEIYTTRQLEIKMKTTCHPAISVTVFIALAAATPCNTPIAALAVSSPVYPVTTPTPNTFVDVDMTIAITNMHGTQLSLSFALGTSAGSAAPSPRGDPTSTVLPDASSTQYAFPPGWNGMICVGPNFNAWNSKIEGSYTNKTDVDVSYVDGYSVPITCSSNGVAFTGCNIDLFNQPGMTCGDAYLLDGPLCRNYAHNITEGPPPCFFSACAGAAYTFPSDDDANRYDVGTMISCCIGTSCEAPSRQGNKPKNCTNYG
jgi:hypothetical protein